MTRINEFHTQLNILCFGQAILLSVITMSLPYWPLYISTLGHYSPQEIRYWSAAIYVAPFVSSTISSPIWGRIGDTYGYKPMIIRACLGLFITQTCLLCFSHVFLILLFRFLQGILAGFIVTAQAFALAVSPDQKRGTTIGKLQSAGAIGNLLGPFLGGIIAALAGYHAIFIISSIICGSVTLLFSLTLQEAYPSKQSITDSNSSTESPKLFQLQHHVLIFLAILFFLQSAQAIVTPIFALFVVEKLHGHDVMIGFLYAATGFMIFLSAPRWGKLFDRLSESEHYVHYLIISLLFLSAILQVCQAYSTNATETFILRLLWGICLGALSPVLLRLLADSADKRQQGLYLGFGNSATKLGNLIGIMTGALIEAHLGYTHAFLTISLFYLLSGLLLISMKPIVNKQNIHLNPNN